MSAHAIEVLQSQTDRLRRSIEAAKAEKAVAQATVQQCDDTIERDTAKIEALEEALAAVRRGASKPSSPQPAAQNGHAKLKPTEAIMAMLDAKGTASREELLALADRIETETDKPRHLLQTTLYLLRKRGKIEMDQDKNFRRVKPAND